MTSKEKMNVTRALGELKRLDDRIARATNDGIFVGVAIGSNESATVYGRAGSVAAATTKIQSDYDSLKSDMDKRVKIKSAIVKSNAQTLVDFRGTQLTVADAIELRGSVGYKRQLLVAMQCQLSRAIAVINTQNQEISAKVERQTTGLLSGDKTKVDSSLIASVTDAVNKASKPSLIDPLNIERAISNLSDEVEAIDSELDYILSTSNAKTEIEI